MNKLLISKNQVKLSNLTKVLWPKKGYTKGDLINYYIEMYPMIQDYLIDRPLSLKLFPDGIKGKSFYRKDCPDYAPDWLSVIPIKSHSSGRLIKWITVNQLSDLVWIANQTAIELHAWLSTGEKLEYPDFAVFDLDPVRGMEDTVQVALIIKKILDELELKAYLKTSGASGLHIFIPVFPIYTYVQIRDLLKSIAEMVIEVKPELATIVWQKDKRKDKVYIDYRQNATNKTIPAPYSLRPTPAATVSTPLNWNELKQDLDPADFNLNNIKNRLDLYGDLWHDLLATRQHLPGFLL